MGREAPRNCTAFAWLYCLYRTFRSKKQQQCSSCLPAMPNAFVGHLLSPFELNQPITHQNEHGVRNARTSGR